MTLAISRVVSFRIGRTVDGVGNRKFSGDPEIGLSVFHAHALVNRHGRLRAVSPIDETD